MQRAKKPPVQNDEFDIDYGFFCDPGKGRRKSVVQTHCDFCNKTIFKNLEDFEKNKHNFCCPECHIKYLIKKMYCSYHDNLIAHYEKLIHK